MKMTELKHNALDRNNAVLPALSLVMVGLLSSCGGGDGGAGSPSDEDSSASTTSTASTENTSSGQARLTDDTVVSVQAAIEIQEELELATETSASEQAGVGSPAAANPFANVDSPSLTDTEENTDIDTDALAGEDALERSEGDSTGTSDSAIAQTDTALTDTSEAGDGESGSDFNTSTASNQAEPGTDSSVSGSTDSTDAGNAQQKFVSVTTPGFEGEVMDDAIRISWEVDPTARGYNVYKQADYHTTVFTTEYTDTDVYDDDYYYEIQAFDHDEQFSYVATGLTVSPRTLGRKDPDAPQPKENMLADYEMVFSDEFNGSTLDTSKWNTRFLWGPDVFINGEEQYYVDIANEPNFGFNPFTFDGEFMTINTIETPPELKAKASNQKYLSGLITSYDSFKFTYGYAETRAKFTHGRGYWPAFWLLNAYYVDAKPEIDIMEFIGDNQDVMYHTYHYFDSQGELRSTKSYPVVGIDFTAEFHTFAVEWMPGKLLFYVDGIQTMEVVDANVSQQEMYVLANQAVGGWWAGSPDEQTPFPGKYVIDYIRVYQRITPYDDFQFDQSTDHIPLYIDNPGEVLPNKRPSFDLWPEGYPDGQ